jgi:hypothetical protein
MHLMSALELRQKAILVAHTDRLFDHQIIKPANVHLYRMANDVSQAAIAPGGDGIVLMQDDGTLYVHKMGNLAQSRPLVVQRPDSVTGRVHEPFPTLLLSSSGEYHVAVACDHYTNTEYVFITTIICCVLHNLFTDSGRRTAVFRVFRVDFDAPSVQLLTTFELHDAYRSFVFQEGYLVTRWQQNGTYLISVRKIACSAQEIEEEVVMDVGPEMVECRSS